MSDFAPEDPPSRPEEPITAVASMEPLEERFAERIERQALWGETTSGPAQPHYELALRLVADWDIEDVLAARRAEDGEGIRLRMSFLKEGDPVLSALRLGAHGQDATREVDWSRGFELPMRRLKSSRFLTQLAEMRAEEMIGKGQDIEAVRTLLDALQFAGDLAEGPILIEEMIGLSQLNPDFLIDAVADGSLRELSSEAQQELVHGLSTLNRRLQWKGAGIVGDFLLGVHGLDASLQHGGSGWRSMTGNSGWIPFERPLGLLFATEYVHQWQDALAELDRGFDSGADALVATFQELKGRLAAGSNPISSILMPVVGSSHRSRFYSLGRFRLLVRALTGSVLPGDSWTADHLRVEATDSGERYWLDHELFKDVEVHVAR